MASCTEHIRSYKNGDFTDLTITCGPLTFNVHILVVCSASDFFKKSIKFPVGKEAEEKCINLPEDDPEMIRRLIAYFYLGDYDPSDGNEIGKFNNIKQYESTTDATPAHHPRRGAFGGGLFTPPHCACLSPNTTNVAQPVSKTSFTVSSKSSTVVQIQPNMVEVVNPLTIHATMYALGDKYQVEGLGELAKVKFESCLAEHAQSEDFVNAVQIAYSSTPDSNRGLRDAVVKAFRTVFRTDIKQIPGAEAKLDCIDELSLLLIKSWPIKIESDKPAQTNFASGSFFGGAQPVANPSARGSQAPHGSLFAQAQPASNFYNP